MPSPAGRVARASTSDQPIGVSGQPNAVAIGSGIASTNGVDVTDSEAVARTMLGRSFAVRSLCSRLTQVDAAGCPDVRRRAVQGVVPPGRQVRLGGAGGGGGDGNVEALAVDGATGIAVGVRDLPHQRGLLAGRCDVHRGAARPGVAAPRSDRRSLRHPCPERGRHSGW